MLHSIVAPNMGHPVVHHFGEGAAVWGQAVTPSVAHLVQTCRDIAIDYSRVGPGIVFEVVSGPATLPHVVDASTFRFHAEATAFRTAAGRPNSTIDVVLRCEVGDECSMKLWGRVSAENPALLWDRPFRRGQGITIPVLFTLSFWEISRTPDARMHRLIKDATEKDRRIRELEAQVALSMCAQ